MTAPCYDDSHNEADTVYDAEDEEELSLGQRLFVKCQGWYVGGVETLAIVMRRRPEGNQNSPV